MDRRVIKTKREIRKAFVALIEEKDFDAITVLDITTKAELNRGTFYLHYIDKYDLLQQYEQELITKLEAVIERSFAQNMGIQELVNSRYETIIEVLSCLQEEKELLSIILKTKGIISLQESAKKLFIRIYEGKITAIFPQNQLMYPLELLTQTISGVFISILQYWLNTNMLYSPEKLAQLIQGFITKGPINTFITWEDMQET